MSCPPKTRSPRPGSAGLRSAGSSVTQPIGWRETGAQSQRTDDAGDRDRAARADQPDTRTHALSSPEPIARWEVGPARPNASGWHPGNGDGVGGNDTVSGPGRIGRTGLGKQGRSASRPCLPRVASGWTGGDCRMRRSSRRSGSGVRRYSARRMAHQKSSGAAGRGSANAWCRTPWQVPCPPRSCGAPVVPRPVRPERSGRTGRPRIRPNPAAGRNRGRTLAGRVERWCSRSGGTIACHRDHPAHGPCVRRPLRRARVRPRSTRCPARPSAPRRPAPAGPGERRRTTASGRPRSPALRRSPASRG